jgi:hypothetical protein
VDGQNRRGLLGNALAVAASGSNITLPFIPGERDKTEATLQFEYPPEISVIWNE